MSLAGVVARHRGPFFVGLIVVGIAVVTTLTIATGTGGRTDRPAATSATTTAPPGPVAALTQLVARGQTANVDVAYTGTDTTGSPFTAHLWRRGPLARLDQESGSGDGATRTRQLVTSTGGVSCTQTGSAPWSCVPKPDLRIGDLGGVSPALVKGLSELDVSVRDDRVAGQDARCFTVATPTASTATTVAAAQAAELCLTSDGIPVRVNVGPTRLDVVSLDRGRPPDSVFTPPA